ncbi:MAG: EamA family transporter RarD [Gammaproteobacteria bacterium]|nr:EamA family transporter RarD [Gammaproteobacteria bacterium]
MRVEERRISARENAERRTGVWFALAAYGYWGVAPVYFKWVEFASPLEIVAHRVVWSVVLLAMLIVVRRQQYTLRRLGVREVGWLAVSGVLVSINWGVFVWALQADRMLETSLGYYINPIVNVLLGWMFLSERLRPAQVAAVALASLGVLNEIVAVGVVPWAGVALALSFGFYGLVRKKLAVDSAVGLGVETLLLLPIALGYLGYLMIIGEGTLAYGTGAELALLAAGGLVTVFPLVCFAAAALRLSLSALGFFQYLAPSITFGLAIFVYGEPFRLSQTVTFGCIWLALVIFSMEGLYHRRKISA